MTVLSSPVPGYSITLISCALSYSTLCILIDSDNSPDYIQGITRDSAIRLFVVATSN